MSGETKTPLIASTRRDFSPQFSPDAGKIAFASDRSGGWEIYVSDAQGNNAIQLTSFGNAVADAVRWSPDGRDLIFAALLGSNRDIYVVSADGGSAHRLTTEPSDEGRPSYSMDGKWIYFRSNRSGKDQIWKMPRGGGQASQVTQAGGFEALESLDGKILYYLPERVSKGLWSMPPEGGAAHAVEGLEGVWQGRWDVTQDGVCYIEQAPQGKERAILCRNSATGKLTKMGVVDKPIFVSPPGLSASRDGRRFLWHQTDHADADLVLVNNFR